MTRQFFVPAILLVALIGCSKPEREGPQVSGLPAGLRYDGNLTSARVVFPDREQGHQRGYMTMGEPHSSVAITEFPGPTTRKEADAARQALEARYGDLDYGDLEDLKIDGRDAWGWIETQHYRGKLSSREYKAVVSHDDITYTVEFYSAQPELRDAAILREHVCRFEIGRTKVNEAAITAGFVMAFGFVALMMLLNRGNAKKS